jgi:hypothetical protein
MRDALIATLPSATAFRILSRSTRSPMSACRVGRSIASAAPKTTATANIDQNPARPLRARMPRAAELMPRADWVARRMRRRG